MARGRGKATPQEKEAMEFVSTKIRQLLDENNLKQSHLADKLDIPRSSFNEYVRGNALPRPGNVQKIADYFGLLKSDIDPRFKSNKPTHPSTPQKPSDLRLARLTDNYTQLDDKRRDRLVMTSDKLVKEMNNDDTVEEELFEYHVYEKLSAGIGTAYFEDRNYDTVYFDEEIDHDLASWVYGDSMEPDYLNGSVALIKGTGFDYDGAIYAVDWDGQSYIKKVYKEKDGLRLVSLNKKYADKFAPYDEEPRIIGKIVGNFMPMEN